MAYSFDTLRARLKETESWLQSEYSTIRTGQATPAILDKVQVDSYGSMMPIKNVANVAVEDAKTIRVSPWDATQLVGIEKAIINADLGVSVVNDGQGLRVIFPELTGESRQRIAKIAKQKLEDARVSLRKEREATWDEIQKSEKDGEISEDEKFRAKEDMQKIVDEANKALEEMGKKKETEILN